MQVAGLNMEARRLSGGFQNQPGSSGLSLEVNPTSNIASVTAAA